MLRTKPVFNYDVDECNLLFKQGVFPIGCGTGDKDGRVFHVFIANKQYFEIVNKIREEKKSMI